MFAIIHLLATFIADLFKPPRRLEVENLFLRHQLNVALRRAPQRVRLRAGDRALMVWMTGCCGRTGGRPSCGVLRASPLPRRRDSKTSRAWACGPRSMERLSSWAIDG